MDHNPSQRIGTFRRAVVNDVSFTLFYSNISSLSSHAKNYIFSMPKYVSAMACVECHKEDSVSVESMFRANGFKAAYSPAEKLTILNHGG